MTEIFSVRPTSAGWEGLPSIQVKLGVAKWNEEPILDAKIVMVARHAYDLGRIPVNPFIMQNSEEAADFQQGALANEES